MASFLIEVFTEDAIRFVGEFTDLNQASEVAAQIAEDNGNADWNAEPV